MSQLSDFLAEHGHVVNVKSEDDPSSAIPGKMVRRYVMSDGSEVVATEEGEVLESKLPEAKPPTKREAPREKDEGGRRYVYNEDKAKWEDVGPAPPNPQERAAAEAARAEKERQEALARQAEQQREANRLAQERLDAERANTAADNARADSAEARAQATYNRPQIISAPPGQRRIAQADASGNISSVDNPNFDQAAYDRQVAQEQAKAERDRLALQIEAGKLTEATAAAQYKRWFDENVTLPLQRAQEARARAAELRAAQEAEDRRQQFAATYEKDRQTTAIGAGERAASNFNQNLQYQVGPKFGEQFSQALNSFQPGAPPANFTADAFTFKGPSIEAVARKATATALAGISPYAKAIATAGQREPTVASYGPGMEPASIAPSAAPPQGTPPDYAGMINQYLQNNPYTPGAGGGEGQ